MEVAHKLNCTEEADKRKVKAARKEREEAGVKSQKNSLSGVVKFAEENNTDTRFVKEVIAAFNDDTKEEKRKGGKKRKPTPSSNKAGSQQIQGDGKGNK